ncbi:MAG: thioredoxin [Planctomycetota bacterium]|nr:MAG: thioredoxin [Planctomycetota bacterium]
MKIGIVLVLAASVGGILTWKASQVNPTTAGPEAGVHSPAPPARDVRPLPRLVDLGAGKCIPCRMMAPILEELKAQYAGRLRVDFYDVWENRDIGKKFGVRMIPTQIFYDAAGRELWRHEGFMSKQDILAKWKKLGIDLADKPNGVTGEPARRE